MSERPPLAWSAQRTTKLAVVLPCHACHHGHGHGMGAARALRGWVAAAYGEWRQQQVQLGQQLADGDEVCGNGLQGSKRAAHIPCDMPATSWHSRPCVVKGTFDGVVAACHSLCWPKLLVVRAHFHISILGCHI